MIYREPEDTLSPVIDIIRSSKKRLYMNFYLIDDQRILSEIKELVSRGLDVKIIIDGRPCGDSNAENELENLLKTGAAVKKAPKRFETDSSFDHAKYLFNEKYFMIGTANLTEAAFSRNREYIIIEKTRSIRKNLEKIFDADWNDKMAGDFDSIVVSPGSEDAILSFIENSRKILIESEELGDDEKILNAMIKKGKKLKIILPDTLSETDYRNSLRLRDAGVRIRYMPKNKIYMHAKMMVSKYGFIGSQNFTKASLNNNREVGLIFKSYKYKSLLKRTFKKDWKMAEKRPGGRK
ncbi:phospholipase D-like domain-containing protein [Picrophilus oshimae]|uniref:Hypothetical cardiolipin synthase n=1 Tax=Picrophilus torridus (strain ATCC 700027 / DSM 9790 / JCM 10055 / NBRC 100828 / KAW 2/3) TaxID=1122961 RepID=Q6L0C5_PICTO|nr:phospholipase D-like domain-containing protein [Picrophilus oshimae]AAT43577.1 hypothetical cardiolipin synthase [Picrophilus oshimae DSM 9789]